MAEKKRKRASEGQQQSKVSRRAKGSSEDDNSAVHIYDNCIDWQPILAQTPGFRLPSSLSFDMYQTTSNNNSKQKTLLHSQDHPTLDYTISQEALADSQGYLQRYIAIFDPQTQKLDVITTCKMTARSSLKSARPRRRDIVSAAADMEATKKTNLDKKTLSLQFGSKNSQKSVRNLSANTIAGNTTSQVTTLDPLAETILSDLREAQVSTSTVIDTSKPDLNRPLPTANLDATTPSDVYTLADLLGSPEILTRTKILDWKDAITNKTELRLESKFVAKRLAQIIHADNIRHARALRHLSLLLRWHKSLKPAGKSGKKSPRLKDPPMLALAEEFGQDVLRTHVYDRFTDSAQDDGKLTRFQLDYLISHILAIALVLDGFVTDIQDITYDLGLKVEEVVKLYKALGCRVEVPSKTERERKGITSQEEAQARRVATLRLPLVFPKGRRMQIK